MLARFVFLQTRYEIPFGGESTKAGVWIPGEGVMAVAYDNPIPGWKTDNTISLRLWGAEPINQFDLTAFNVAKYTDAVASANAAATISSVLYPEDSTQEGKMLRLKQQFFFTSASLQVRERTRLFSLPHACTINRVLSTVWLGMGRTRA